MMIYVAAAYGRQLEMRGVRTQLRALGHQVTSRWLDQEIEVQSFTAVGQAPAAVQVIARRDLNDIERAHAVLSFTDGGLARGTRHVEFGYAMALGKRLVVIGPRENVFHCLGRVAWYPDWPTLYDEMQHWAVDMKDLIEEERVH